MVVFSGASSSYRPMRGSPFVLLSRLSVLEGKDNVSYAIGQSGAHPKTKEKECGWEGKGEE